MDRLGLLKTFATAVEEGSLNRAAQHCNITQSAVSQQIKQLETLLGQQLLHRSSKGVHATRAGELVYPHAQKLLGGFDELKAELTGLNDTIAGTLRLSVSNALGRSVLGPLLIELNNSYPDLNIVMRLEDRLVDVVRENYDLAIRTGGLGDTDGIGRKIASLETVLFATPSYLDRVGRPETHEDLRHLALIQHHEDQTKGSIPVYQDGKEYHAPIRVGFTVDDPDLIQMAVENGSGYARIPRFMIKDQLAAGTYEVVMPHYQSNDKPVYAVYPSRHTACRRQDVILKKLVTRLTTLETEAARDHSTLRVITA